MKKVIRFLLSFLVNIMFLQFVANFPINHPDFSPSEMFQYGVVAGAIWIISIWYLHRDVL